MDTGTGGGTLVARLRDALRAAIADGTYPPGGKLPSEAQLCREHGVSRTVVREAVAALRADGLVQPRQGAGVFVLQPQEPVEAPFRDIDFDRVSSMIELLELRTAVEAEAAALAALRRSPAQEERILDGHNEVQSLASAGKSTADADYRLHLAIADATNNPRFRDFLSMMGPGVIPRRALKPRRRGAGVAGLPQGAGRGTRADRLGNSRRRRRQAPGSPCANTSRAASPGTARCCAAASGPDRSAERSA